MGLGAVRHREALFGLRLRAGRGVLRPPLRSFVWTSAVQCRDRVTPGMAFSISRTIELSAVESRRPLGSIGLLPHTVTLHPAGSCNWPAGGIRSPFVRDRS